MSVRSVTCSSTSASLEIAEKFGDKYNIPVLHFSQLLGLAQGMSPEELGLSTHQIKVDKLLDRIV